jgi:hypothetical protein
MAIEILRVGLGDDASAHVAALLRDAARAAEPFAPAPVLYVSSHERRARAISRQAGEQYPEGTPDRVARELLKLFAPEIRLRGEVERDFDFFAALAEALSELGETRRAGRALVDELLVAWKRFAQAVSPDQRGDKQLAAWLPSLGRRGELFGAVVRRYLARLKQSGQHDPEDACWLAARLGESLAPGLLVVDDLDRITPGREALLAALAARSRRALFILRGNRELLPFLAQAHEISQQLMFASEGRVLPEGEWPQRALADACDNWLRDAPVNAAMEVLRPANRAAEVREAARAIKRARHDGLALSEICVAMPSTGNYRELIEETFAAAGIPYDAPFELPLDETAPVAALLDLLRAAIRGLGRNELLDALASPFVPFDAADEAAQLAVRAALDEVTREAFIVGGRNVARDWLQRLEASNHKAWPAIAAPVRHILLALEPFTHGRIEAVKFFKSLEALLEASGMRHVVTAERGADPGAALRAEALHAFRALLREMREEFRRGGNPALPGAELLRALLEQARTRSVRPPEAAAERVRVLGLRELRGISYRRLIVLGLTDQDLPLTEEETLFLPAASESALEEVLGPRVASELCAPIDVTAQADYLFAHTLLAAAGPLTLMLPAGEGDTPFVPATPFARLLRCMGREKLEERPACSHGEPPVSASELAARAASLLALAERGGAKAKGAIPLSEPLAAGLHGRCIELARTDLASPPGEFEGVVGTRPELDARFAAEGEQRHRFSPSQLDSFAECPMRFWSRYIVAAKAPDEPSLDTKPQAIGTLLHAVFERWVLLLREKAGQPAVLPEPVKRAPVRLLELGADRAEARAIGLQLMVDAFEQVLKQHPTEGPFWEGVKKLVAAGLPGHAEAGLGEGLLVRLVDHELKRNAEGHGIRFVEFDFGKGNAPEPARPDTVPDQIELAIPGGAMRLMGSVDRVDEGPEGLEIVDYKTGKVKTTAEIRDGKAFQLAAYLAAISQVAGTPPRGMAYVQVPPEGAIKRIDVTLRNNKPAFDVNELVFTRLPQRLARILEALRHGVFMHLPFRPSGNPCGYCDYAAACARRDDVIATRQQRLAAAETPEVAHVYLPDTEEA